MATPIPPNFASFTLGEIARAIQGQLKGQADERITGVAIDSRAVVKGGAFFAIRGEQQDGAQYLPQAMERGAAVLIVHSGTPCPSDVAVIEVDDTTRALGDLARFHRQRWGKPVIAITGSAGKTTTKELTASACATIFASVLKTVGNLNNQFGVPMTLLCLTEHHDLAVLEVGTSARGEIARLGEIAKPDVAVVVLAAAAHTQGIGTVQDVADEKASLWGALSAQGVAIVNADDVELMARRRKDVRTISFGTSEAADVRLLAADLTLDGTRIRLSACGRELSITLKLLGEGAALDAVAALAAVIALRGETALDQALQGLARTEPTPSRMALLRTRSGLVVLDDSYNSNPRSTAMALEALVKLARLHESRSIAVLGDMKELGQLSQTEHARIGELAVRLGVDVLVGAGTEMAFATSQAARLSAGRLAPHPTRVIQVREAPMATPIVKSLCRPGDVLLVKGSRSMSMERVVAELMVEDAKASKGSEGSGT